MSQETAFQFNYENRRFGRLDRYTIEWNETGWQLTGYPAMDKFGNKILFEKFERDNISYPSSFGKYMGILWDDINYKKLTTMSEIQERLDELTHWLSVCEQNTPSWR